MDKANNNELSPFSGGIESLADIHKLHRLSLRIYGQITWNIQEQITALVNAADDVLKKSSQKALQEILQEELPVILALHALDCINEYADDKKLAEQLREMLIPCFALSYSQLYADKTQDPLRHILAKLDWYLDGDQESYSSVLAQMLRTLLGNKLKAPEPLINLLNENILPEINQRFLTAWRLEFS